MKIYILKWVGSSGTSIGDKAYTDKERAERVAEKGNKHISWYARMLGYRWVVSSLNLKEGPKDV